MSPEGLLVSCLFWGLFWAVICNRIGAKRNNEFGATLAGVFLGPIGVVLALVTDKRESCPKCKMKINNGAEICPHCHSPIEWSGGKPKPQSTKSQRAMSSDSDDNDEVDLARFRCPACKEFMTWPASYAGTRVDCGNCGASATVPDIYAGFEVTAKRKLRACPDCDAQISKRATQCPHCGCPLDDE